MSHVLVCTFFYQKGNRRPMCQRDSDGNCRTGWTELGVLALIKPPHSLLFPSNFSLFPFCKEWVELEIRRLVHHLWIAGLSRNWLIMASGLSLLAVSLNRQSGCSHFPQTRHSGGLGLFSFGLECICVCWGRSDMISFILGRGCLLRENINVIYKQLNLS